MPVELIINQQAISAESGMTVLEAARANGIYIPTLCYAPKLKPFGGCRMCVVEIDKMGGLPTACTVPVTAGMVVRSETPAVQTQRRETLSLLLSEHPYTCLTCNSKNGCVEFQGTIRKAAVTTGCNYCPKNGQCEIQVVLDHVCVPEVPYPITYRGLPVEHDDPFFDRDMNLCIVCGRCVRACEDLRLAGVLALVQRGDHTVVGTAAGRSLIEAGCQFCGACVDACPTGALFDKKSKWEGVPTSIVPSVCPYCAVGCAVNIQASRGKVLRAVGIDGAAANDGEVCVRGRFGIIDVVHNGARLKSPMLKHGTRQLPVTWEAALDEAAQGLAPFKGDQFAAIGSATATNEDLYLLQRFTRKVMGSNNIALSTSAASGAELEMQRADRAPIAAIRASKAILVIGANAYDSHPIIGLEIRQAVNAGAKLITIDPRRTKMAKKSKVWLGVRPGADQVILAGLLGELRIDQAAAQSGTTVQTMQAASDILAQQTPVTIIYGSGVTGQTNLLSIKRLGAKLGATVIGLPADGNSLGANDMGLHPSLLPGYRPAAAVGRDLAAILQGIRAGEIKALYLAGDVPALAEFAQVPFLIVQGVMHSDIVKHARVVFPATTFVEMDGTMTNLEGRVQRLHKVINPIGQARAGWMIMRDLAGRMGVPWDLADAGAVYAAIAAEIPAYPPSLDGSAGALRRFGDGGISLQNDAPPPSVLPVSIDFPMTLLVERNRFVYAGVSLTQTVKGLDEIKEENVLHLSPADAARLGLAAGQAAQVSSAHGVARWPVAIDDGLQEGAAFISINPMLGSPIFPNSMPDGASLAVSVSAAI